MERIHVEVTNRCNFRCEFCPQGLLQRPPRDMEMDLFKSICDQLEGGGIAKEIHFHILGEPLLFRPLPEAVAYATACGVSTVMTTNGSLLTPALASELSVAGLSRLILSLQTPDERSFRLRCAGNLSFETYERNVVAALRSILAAESSPSVVLAFRTTAFPMLQAPGSDLRILSDTATLRAQLRAWADRVLGGTIDQPALEQAHSLIRRARVSRWNVVHATPRFTLESRPLGGWVKPASNQRFYPAHFGTCHGIGEMFGVQANGDLTFCCADWEGETRVGNARDMPLARFFENQEVLRAHEGFRRLRIVHPRCQRCLGEPGLLPSLGHQIGSIVYLRFYRKYFRKEIDL